MARNIEIKARVHSLQALEPTVALLATAGPLEMGQDDTFFICRTGRLKLREFQDGRAELIFYRRADSAGPRESHYTRSPVPEPAVLREMLGAAMGLEGRVRKSRRVYWSGRTRIHLDQVEGLGEFLELEVVLQDGESAQAGMAEAQLLMNRLGVQPQDLLSGSYLDLLERLPPKA